jgi:hypothetical protein
MSLSLSRELPPVMRRNESPIAMVIACAVESQRKLYDRRLPLWWRHAVPVWWTGCLRWGPLGPSGVHWRRFFLIFQLGYSDQVIAQFTLDASQQALTIELICSPQSRGCEGQAANPHHIGVGSAGSNGVEQMID